MINTNNIVLFSNQFIVFESQGQFPPAPPPPAGGAMQFLVSGPDLTEQFVTGGRISALNVSYTINPLSRRTV